MRSTKKQLLEAFNEVVKRFNAQDSGEPAPKVEAEQKRRKETVALAKDHSMEGIVQSVGALKLGIGEMLNDLTGKLVVQVERLRGVEEAITIEEQRLADLHDIEIAADTLAVLLERKAEAEAEYQRRVDEKRQEVEAALLDAREELEAEMHGRVEAHKEMMTETRAQWGRDQNDYEAEVTERVDQVQRERKREEEEYQYNLKIRRQREEDAHDARKDLQEKELAAKREAVEQELARREAAVAEREADLEHLRVEAEAFPGRLKEAVAEAHTQGRVEAEQKARVAAELLEQGVAGEKELARHTIETLKEKVQERAGQLSELSKQVNEAQGKVQTIATQGGHRRSGRSQGSGSSQRHRHGTGQAPRFEGMRALSVEVGAGESPRQPPAVLPTSSSEQLHAPNKATPPWTPR